MIRRTGFTTTAKTRCTFMGCICMDESQEALWDVSDMLGWLVTGCFVFDKEGRQQDGDNELLRAALFAKGAVDTVAMIQTGKGWQREHGMMALHDSLWI